MNASATAWAAVACLVWATGAGAYEEIEVLSPGAIEGRVSYRGPRPEAAYLPVLKNADVCGERVPDESLRVSAEGGLAGAVVELVGVSAGKKRGRVAAVLDNRECAFVPRVQVVPVGGSLEIRNSDPILHDAHAWVGPKTIFNLGLPEWRRVSHTFEEPGLHAIDCNVLHTWMKAFVFVPNHPYATVTEDDGTFLLEDVPLGTYELRVWHETLGEKRRSVTVGADQRLGVELSFP